MAHQMTPADAAIILSGVLLVISLFALSGMDDESCATCNIRARAVQAFFSSLGEIFWFVWLGLCSLILAGGLILKLTHHEFAWKERPPQTAQNQPLAPTARTK